jgi:tetratricopeptide (TPR) repeat protein
VESVAWVAERKTVLAALLLLLSLRAYASWAREGGRGRYAAALALFALSLTSKPLGVALPLLLPLLEWWPLGRGAPGRRALAAAAPFAALSAASCAATLATAVYVSDVPLAQRLLQTPVFLARYLGKILWPAPLSVFYPYPDAAPAPEAWGWAAVLLLSVTAWALRARRARPGVLVGWLWFLAFLLPTAGPVAVGSHSIAERFVYVPLLGLAAALAWLVDGSRLPAAAPVAAAACLGALMTAAGVRVLAWESGARLFSSSLDAAPRSHVLYTHLGYAYLEERKLTEAEQAFLIALKLKPDSLQARHYLGVVYAQEGRRSEAAEEFRRALELKPDSRTIRANLEAVEGAHRP